MLRSGPTTGHDEDASAGTTRDAEISEWIQGDADASVFGITNFCSYASTNTISKREHVSSRRFGSDLVQRRSFTPSDGHVHISHDGVRMLRRLLAPAGELDYSSSSARFI